ncbi:Sulfite reductase [NADPH] flavoprotein alpha-component [Thalassoglobus neptunius]|uniref:assimilatory sulfite reductase (NADPH) n=2 Tax=Thalassoglobus neptunius TaxID=1938619 RepID=A0A5C5W6Z8_9PLAN|nr:Sulfite reductase [NADPH] flavoprotein alpha-component [Thalassoglobus neptunius]
MAPVSLLPESAPFSDEQRAWLDGFLSGWLGIQDQGGGLSVMDAIPHVEEEEVEEEDHPWHDPAIEMEERLEMAKDRPVERQLMAAMAQLDCGSCGYDCQRYAEAIVNGEEKSLKLCSPGGSATAKKLKELVSLNVGSVGAANGKSSATNGNGTATNGNGKAAEQGYSRTNPFPAKIAAIRNLNGTESAKRTSHVEIDLSGSGITYEVGDSLGVYPTNCSELVTEIINELRATGDESVSVDGKSVSLVEALTDHYCLTEITEELLTAMISKGGNLSEAKLLEHYIDDDEDISGWDVLDLLRQFSSAKLTAEELVYSLSPMKPRLYSISSSLKAHPNQVHLTVGRVGWEFRNRIRKGVASTMFSDRMAIGSTVRVFVHRSHGFTVPEDPHAKMIMVGPGTGIAPFRAFLQERQARKASGENWLFFGDQKASCDFLYRDELESLRESGLLGQLDVAFSRDQQEKVYVQDRMRERGAELWKWLNSGAHFFVCGDAKRMAVDVDRTLKEIACEHGGLSEADATAFLSRLAKEKRYCRDVY